MVMCALWHLGINERTSQQRLAAAIAEAKAAMKPRKDRINVAVKQFIRHTVPRQRGAESSA